MNHQQTAAKQVSFMPQNQKSRRTEYAVDPVGVEMVNPSAWTVVR